MIVILGESASGKSTLQNLLVECFPKYNKVVTYTTRPMREGEIDGIDYHFITQSKFDELVEQDFFLEHAQYRDWHYGIAKSDCCNDENAIAVLTPSGFRALKKLGIETTSIYLYVDRRSRLINILKRGDNIDEAYRRNLSDLGQFDGLKNEVDYVIDNTSFHMSNYEVLGVLYKILCDKECSKTTEI